MYFSYFVHVFRTIMQDLGRLVWTPTILTFMNIKRNCFSSLIFSMSTFHIQKIGFNRESSEIADL